MKAFDDWGCVMKRGLQLLSVIVISLAFTQQAIGQVNGYTILKCTSPKLYDTVFKIGNEHWLSWDESTSSWEDLRCDLPRITTCSFSENSFQVVKDNWGRPYTYKINRISGLFTYSLPNSNGSQDNGQGTCEPASEPRLGPRRF